MGNLFQGAGGRSLRYISIIFNFRLKHICFVFATLRLNMTNVQMPYCASNISYVFPDLVFGSKYLCTICCLFVFFVVSFVSVGEERPSCKVSRAFPCPCRSVPLGLSEPRLRLRSHRHKHKHLNHWTGNCSQQAAQASGCFHSKPKLGLHIVFTIAPSWSHSCPNIPG